ncbi:MAG: AAA family ATPase [Bacillus sp. (in: firmicutes)]
MQIKRIAVDGYRNLSKTILDVNHVTGIIAVNNYGKSNFIDAVDFAQDFIKNPPKIKDNMMRSQPRIPINKKTANKNFFYLIEYLTEFDSTMFNVSYSFSFDWIKKGTKRGRIISEELKIKNNEKAKFKTYFKRNKGIANYLSSVTGRCNTKLDINENELVLNKLSNYDSLFYLNIIKELDDLRFDFNSFIETDRAFRTKNINIDESIPSLYDLDHIDGSNICEVVYQLMKHEPQRYELLINSYKSLITEIEDIKPIEINIKEEFDDKELQDIHVPFEIPEKIYDIRIKETQNNQVTSINMLSYGSRRIFILFTSAVLADIKKIPLVFYEELENSIHPRLFQQLLIILSEILSDTKIVITSHSPYLIQYLDLKNIYIGVPNNDKVAKFRKLKKGAISTISKNVSEDEISLGDYIFSMLSEVYYDPESEFLELLEDINE